MAFENEKAGIDADFVDVFGGFDSDFGALVVDVGGHGDIGVLFADFGFDFFEARCFAEGGGGDADDFGAGSVEGDDLFDTGVDVAGFFGDHGLYDDGVSVAHGDGSDAAGFGFSAGVGDVEVHRLVYFTL